MIYNYEERLARGEYFQVLSGSRHGGYLLAFGCDRFVVDVSTRQYKTIAEAKRECVRRYGAEAVRVRG